MYTSLRISVDEFNTLHERTKASIAPKIHSFSWGPRAEGGTAVMLL